MQVTLTLPLCLSPISLKRELWTQRLMSNHIRLEALCCCLCVGTVDTVWLADHVTHTSSQASAAVQGAQNITGCCARKQLGIQKWDRENDSIYICLEFSFFLLHILVSDFWGVLNVTAAIVVNLGYRLKARGNEKCLFTFWFTHITCMHLTQRNIFLEATGISIVHLLMPMMFYMDLYISHNCIGHDSVLMVHKAFPDIDSKWLKGQK